MTTDALSSISPYRPTGSVPAWASCAAFIGLALDAITIIPGRPTHRVAFFLDEFGQLGRMDRIAACYRSCLFSVRNSRTVTMRVP